MSTNTVPRNSFARPDRIHLQVWEIVLLVIVALLGFSVNLLVGGWVLMLLLGACGATSFGFWPCVGIWTAASLLIGRSRA